MQIFRQKSVIFSRILFCWFRGDYENYEIFSEFFSRKICIYQNFVVILQRISKRNNCRNAKSNTLEYENNSNHTQLSDTGNQP